MITYCENPVKLIAYLPEGLQPVSDTPSDQKVWTWNLKTGQVLPVQIKQLESCHPHEVWDAIQILQREREAYIAYMKLNA